jgi:hypothetical protein
VFGRGSSEERRTVYFTAGPGDETHGLLGESKFKGRRGGSGDGDDGDDDDDDEDDVIALGNSAVATLGGDTDQAAGPGDEEFVIVEPAAASVAADESIEAATNSVLRVELAGGSAVHLGDGSAVRFRIAGAGTAPVHFDVFNAAGRLVAQPLRGEVLAGRDEVRWEGRDLHGLPVASGTYFYRATAGAQSSTGRVILVR